MNALVIEIVDTPEEAPNYRRDSVDIRAIFIKKAVIVKKGTVEGQPTVDLVLETETGETFVAIVTGKLLRGLAAVIATNTEDNSLVVNVKRDRREGQTKFDFIFLDKSMTGNIHAFRFRTLEGGDVWVYGPGEGGWVSINKIEPEQFDAYFDYAVARCILWKDRERFAYGTKFDPLKWPFIEESM